jgi:uncharacterized protein (UPF0335 family)
MAENPKPAKEAGNTASKEAIQAFLDRIHTVTDDMEAENAAARSDIKAIYDEAATGLDMDKAALKLIVKKQRSDMKSEKKAKQMDAKQRQTLERCAQAFGADSPMGAYLSDLAAMAGTGSGVQMND